MGGASSTSGEGCRRFYPQSASDSKAAEVACGNMQSSRLTPPWRQTGAEEERGGREEAIRGDCCERAGKGVHGELGVGRRGSSLQWTAD